MELSEIFQSFVNKEYDELVSIATRELSLAIPTLEEFLGEKDAYRVTLALLATCVSTDRQMSDIEKKFLNEVTGIETHEIGEIVRGFTDYEFVDKLVDSCPRDLKNHLLTLALCTMAVDEHIPGKEVAYFKRLIVEE